MTSTTFSGDSKTDWRSVLGQATATLLLLGFAGAFLIITQSRVPEGPTEALTSAPTSPPAAPEPIGAAREFAPGLVILFLGPETPDTPSASAGVERVIYDSEGPTRILVVRVADDEDRARYLSELAAGDSACFAWPCQSISVVDTRRY